MATTTTNFGWDIPQSTDLVKDGATAIAALGQDIDTALVDLKGGTTGQVLAKASNTDLDYTWTSPNPGDITAVTAGTGITGGGTSGDVTVSFDQTNFGGGQYAAGKNKIINGDFSIWQRGTSFTTSGVYTSDRWIASSNATFTASRQTFTPGTAPVAGYEGQFFYRMDKSAGGSFASVVQKIENVRTYAGQTITISFWAKANTTATIAAYASQDFGSGGSGSVLITNTNLSITSSWARYSVTASVPSISGKTIGTNSFLNFEAQYVNSGALTLDLWGVQIEAGSTATPFQTASGTIAGELQLAQRYYIRTTSTGTDSNHGIGLANSTTTAYIHANIAEMRVIPTSVDYANLNVSDSVNNFTFSGLSINSANSTPRLAFLIATGASGMTQFRPLFMRNNNNTAGYLGFSAEL